jgi:hypothetical protein
MPLVTRQKLRPWWAVAAVVGLVYSWIAAGARPFTTPENVMVAIPIAIALVLGARRGGEPAELTVTIPVGEERGTIVWVALLAALVGWELVALFSSPREDHPTLSSVADTIMSVHIGRAAVFALWLAAGAALALDRPRDRR